MKWISLIFQIIEALVKAFSKKPAAATPQAEVKPESVAPKVETPAVEAPAVPEPIHTTNAPENASTNAPIPSPVVEHPLPPIVLTEPTAQEIALKVEKEKLFKVLADLKARHDAREGARASPPPKPALKQVVGDITHKVLTTLSIKKPVVELWIPFATRLGAPYAAATQGNYPRGYPQGLIQHWTAGQYKTKENALATLQDAAKQGYSYLLIDGEGELYQTAPLNRWGWHSGKSSWPGLGQFVHQWLVGLEVCNAGELTKHGEKYLTWWGDEIPASEVRHVLIQTGNMAPGYYHKFNDKQIAAIEKTVRWLHENGQGTFKYDLCLGHDEVSPGRKVDPGGALPYTMKEYRLRLMDGRKL